MPALTEQAIVHGPLRVTGEKDKWELQPDRRVAYKSAKYPWLIAAYRFHNKVNMHSDWDLVNLDMPDHVFNASYLAAKGQDYIVHFSSRSYTDYTYTDAIDVRIHPDKVDKDLIYGKLSGSKWGWFKTDHCQFIEPANIVSPIRDATHDVLGCRADIDDPDVAAISATLGINVVPSTNPDVVPRFTTRDVETVNPLCTRLIKER